MSEQLILLTVLQLGIMGLALAAGGGTAPAPPRVVNGGFEDGDSGLPGWTFRSTHPTPPYDENRIAKGEPQAAISHQARSGGHSLRVHWQIPETDSGQSKWTLSSESILVAPVQPYTVTAWMKGRTGFMCGIVWMSAVALDGGGVETGSLGKDMLIAKSDWQQFRVVIAVPSGCSGIQVRFQGSYHTDLFLDDVEVQPGILRQAKVSKPPVEGFARHRLRERLDRGVVALPMPGKRVYVGWRLLPTDPDDVAFNIYRRTGSSPAVRLNGQPVYATTGFVDPNPSEGESAYSVRSLVDGAEGSSSEVSSATPSPEGQPYISIRFAGDYAASKVGVGDLDGDGRYEYVIKQPGLSLDPWIDGGWRPSPDTYKLEAYRQDGTLLWRYDMGWAIEMGVWYSPFVVYDLDGDGCAEVALRIGEGDPRDAEGRAESGPEYLVVLDGRTGKERARAAWPPREGFYSFDRVGRNQLGIAYLDGKTPCLIVQRGSYDTMYLLADQFDGRGLRELWRWNEREEEGLTYSGQGAHCLHAADVDGDGRDEVIIGAAVIDDNGVGLWSLPLGHPDHVGVGDLDPTRPGLQIQLGCEYPMQARGMCQVDASTGEMLWALDEQTFHVSTGLTADLDPGHPGAEFWAYDEELKKHWLFSAQGKLLSQEAQEGIAAYWDADTQREIRSHGRMRNYLSGRELDPTIEGKVLAVADILGDWREEIITSLPGELRIYTTTIPATDRRLCLLYDPIYRIDVCGESQGYLSLPGFAVLPGLARHQPASR